MDKRLFVVLAIALPIGSVTRAQLILPPVSCLHDASERQTDRARREQALVLAKAINAQQGILAQQTRRYHHLSDLKNLPQLPAGFELRLYAEPSGYVVSLKDRKDACAYAVFSDQAGLLYEKSPRTEAVMARAPAEEAPRNRPASH